MNEPHGFYKTNKRNEVYQIHPPRAMEILTNVGLPVMLVPKVETLG